MNTVSVPNLTAATTNIGVASGMSTVTVGGAGVGGMTGVLHAGMGGGGAPRSFMIFDGPYDPEIMRPSGDAYYPIEQPTHGSTLFWRFHLRVWQQCRNALTARSLAEDLFIFDRAAVMFRNQKARAEFRRWWKRYATRFPRMAPSDCYLPQFPTGAVSGVFVEHPMEIDYTAWSVRSDTNVFRGSPHDVDEEMLRSVLPIWAWIIHHTRKRCWRVPGGWIFESKVEASKFVFCGRGKDLHPAEVTHA